MSASVEDLGIVRGKKERGGRLVGGRKKKRRK
jgi:hypothetical protein